MQIKNLATLVALASVAVANHQKVVWMTSTDYVTHKNVKTVKNCDVSTASSSTAVDTTSIPGVSDTTSTSEQASSTVISSESSTIASSSTESSTEMSTSTSESSTASSTESSTVISTESSTVSSTESSTESSTVMSSSSETPSSTSESTSTTESSSTVVTPTTLPTKPPCPHSIKLGDDCTSEEADEKKTLCAGNGILMCAPDRAGTSFRYQFTPCVSAGDTCQYDGDTPKCVPGSFADSQCPGSQPVQVLEEGYCRKQYQFCGYPTDWRFICSANRIISCNSGFIDNPDNYWDGRWELYTPVCDGFCVYDDFGWPKCDPTATEGVDCPVNTDPVG